jgi:hypothetical protein
MTTTTGWDDAGGQRRPYVFPSMQSPAEIDPASIEVPVGAVDVRGPLPAGPFRPPHLPAGADAASFHYLSDATGSAAERRLVAQVLAAHDGGAFR